MLRVTTSELVVVVDIDVDADVDVIVAARSSQLTGGIHLNVEDACRCVIWQIRSRLEMKQKRRPLVRLYFCKVPLTMLCERLLLLIDKTTVDFEGPV